MIPVKFDKERTLELLDALANGGAVAPPGQGWTGNDLLALAGACLFVAMSQGPRSFRLRDIPKTLTDEYKEAEEETFDNDLHAAIGFYGHLTMLVKDQEYDAAFAPRANALVTTRADLAILRT